MNGHFHVRLLVTYIWSFLLASYSYIIYLTVDAYNGDGSENIHAKSYKSFAYSINQAMATPHSRLLVDTPSPYYTARTLYTETGEMSPWGLVHGNDALVRRQPL